MSMEPWILEQQRTMALEAILDRYPKCDCCGDAITTDTYLVIFGKNVCRECVDRNTQYNMEAITYDC